MPKSCQVMRPDLDLRASENTRPIKVLILPFVMQPFLSIVIPCHNRRAMLGELIESIPRIDDLEVIVVDDHSTEDLSQVSLEEFKHHKFIKNKPINLLDPGIASSRQSPQTVQSVSC
mgnify:CR=1 FL=1